MHTPEQALSIMGSSVDPPSSFLINGNVNDPNSSWEINSTSPAWSAIFADPTHLLDDPVVGSGTTLVVSSGYFWGLQFSNSANTPIFGSKSPAVTDPQDPTIQGAVFTMLKPTGLPLNGTIMFGDVRTKFGISSSNSPALLNSFLDEIDQSGTLALSLNVLPTTKNALWAVPGDVYKVVVTLTFDIQAADSLADIQNFLNTQFNLKLNPSNVLPQVIITSIMTYTLNSASPDSTYSMIFRFQISTFQVSIVFTPTDVELILSDLDTTSSNGTIYQRLNDEVLESSTSGSPTKLGPNDLPDNSKSSAFDKFLSGIILWNVIIGIDSNAVHPPSGSAQPGAGNVFLQIGLIGAFHIGSNSQEVLVAVTFDSRTSSFSGKLVPSKDIPNANVQRQYDYQVWSALPPTLISLSPAPDLDIGAIFGTKRPPPQIDPVIKEASIVFQKPRSGDGYTFVVSANITSAASSNPAAATAASAPAPSNFDWSQIKMNVMLQSDGSNSSALIQVLANINLAFPPSSSSSTTANGSPAVHLDLQYVSDNYWFLEAQADNIPLTQLSDYFDSSVKDRAMSAVGGLQLQALDFLYTFTDAGDASSFLITATLVLGELELDLYYQYGTPSLTGQSAADLAWANGNQPDQVTPLSLDSNTPTWTFEAFLGANSPNSTIQSVVMSIWPKAKTILPGFVGNIKVNPASGGNSAGKLKLQKIDDALMLIVQVLLLDLEFTFVSTWTGTESKMILRISVDQIPVINSIPLIKLLPQPFDSLLYLWLDDDSGAGLTQPEIDKINLQLASLNVPKIATKDNNGSSLSAAALQAGHHFMILEKGDVVLDHVFNNINSQDPNPPGATGSDAVAVRQLDGTTEQSDPAPTKGNLDVQLPFLSVSAVTLQFKQATLFIDIDATLKLGPINVSVIGFEIGLHLTNIELNHLEDITKYLTFGIHGLSVSIDQSPLEIAGVFIHNNSDGVEEYIGGVGITFEAWQFLAVGAYEVITSGQSNYKSVFVYAKLNGPLVSLAFATISGVRLGFGYNSIVRSPSMVELPKFPFLSGSAEDGSGNDPIEVLQAMFGTGGSQPWVSPKEDSYWVAAGLNLTAFGILSITAVLMLGFHDSGVVISVLADGIAQMPPDVDADATLFYVEIYMIAELNTVEGYFTVQASLAPSSHVLVPSCRLTGGFALVNWFDPNTHAGDFVFTVGGFHPAYSPPAWYPVPPRLGISFTLGGMINVTGTVYFAITPKCVMGGGALHMGLDVGPVSAWLDISLDVFIQFKPFHYTADLKVSVGCAISINVWFVHVRISVSVGAALHIQGPDPFGGVANVDFYLFSFTIHFGSQSNGPPALDLLEFYEMVKTPGPAPADNSSATPEDPAMTQLKFVLTAGIYHPLSAPAASATNPPQFPDSGASTIWQTKAGTFACTIGCAFALSAAILVDDEGTPNPSTRDLPPADGSANAPTFWSKPMHADVSSSIVSTLSVTVWVLNPDGTKDFVQGDFNGVMAMTSVPAAIWGTYDPTTDPAQSPNPSDLTKPDQPTMSLCMGVSLTPPEPTLVRSLIQDFDATAAFRWSLGSWPIPAIAPIQSKSLASGIVYGNQTPEDRWLHVASDWTAFGQAGASILGGEIVDGKQSPGLLQMVAQSLGWNKPSPSGTLETDGMSTSGTSTTPAGSASWILKGAAPNILITDLATQYPVLPRYSAATTA